MKQDTRNTDQATTTTLLGEVIEQMHDHRVRADEPQAQFVFCSQEPPAIVDKNQMFVLDAD